MIETLNELAAAWWSWMGPMLWQVALLGAVVAAVDLALSRRGWPQVRYALWLLVLARLLIPPTFSLPSSLSARFLPTSKAAAAAVATEAPASALMAVPPPIEYAANYAPMPAPPAEPVETPVVQGPSLSLHAWAMLLSGGVSLLLLSWLALTALRLRRLAAGSADESARPQWLDDVLKECRRKLGLRRLPRLVVTERIPAAAVFGLFRPVILLPRRFCEEVSRDQMELILLHELTHIKRGDLLVNAAQTLLQIAYWYHPVVWFAGRRLRQLRELCCDGTVSTVLRERTPEYRETLIAAARSLLFGKGGVGMGLLGLFESKSRLRQRLQHLERPIWKHARLKLIASLAAVALMLACVVPMAKSRGLAWPTKEEAGKLSEAETGELAALSVPLMQVHVEPLSLEAETFFYPEGDWFSVGDGLWWRYTGGRRLRFTRHGARIYLSTDGGPPRVTGVHVRVPEELRTLHAALADSSGPLTVWVDCPVLDKILELPNLGKIGSLQLGKLARVSDLSALPRMTQLTSLRIRHCENVTDLEPLSSLTNLESLSLPDCANFSDLSPLANLTRLASLDLSQCRKISDLSPLGHLTNLTSLSVSFCRQVRDISSLAKLGELEVLDLTMCTEVRDLSPIAKLNNLTALWLPPGTTDQDLEDVVANHPNLTSLSLHPCHKVWDLSPLIELTDLNSLDLRGCDNVSDLSPLTKMASLTQLTLGEGVAISNLAPIGSLTNLKSLRLHRCNQISDLSPLATLSNLTKLQLAFCEQVSDLSPLAKLPNLTFLYLMVCGEVSDLSPVGRLRDLKSLYLHGCQKVSDLSPLASLTELSKLNIGGLIQVSDLLPLSNLTDLKRLTMTSCMNVPNLSALAQLPELTWVDLRGCDKVTELSPLRKMADRGGTVIVSDRLKPQLEKLRGEVAAAAPAPVDLANKAVLRGTVKRADNGKPLPGVTVELLDMRARPIARVASTKSGPDGRFEMISNRAGEFYMIARADGWFSQFDKLPYREVSMIIGEVAKPVEIGMTASGTFAGRVVAKGTGKPLAGVSIRIQSGLLSAETDREGKFRFTGLPVGMGLRMSTTAPGYGIDVISVSVASGEAVERTITLDQQAVFTGRVLDANGKPIEGAEVHCSTDNRGSWEHWTVQTGRKGWYQIQRVNRGAHYRIYASKQAYISHSEEVRVSPDAEIVKVNFTLKSGLSASGKVVDREGKPVAGVTVHWGRGYDHRVKTTGADGRFAFKGLKSEHANEVYAVKPGYAMGTVRVDPKDPNQANNVIVKLKPELTISGVVLDTKGKPVPNAQLMIGRQAPTLQQTQTDGQGRFTMRTLEERDYKITVMSRKPRTIQESVPIKAGTTDARIVLREFGRIAGRVVDDATGKPIRSFNIRMARSRTGGFAPGLGMRMMRQGIECNHGGGIFELRRDYNPDYAYRLIISTQGYEWGEVDDVHSGTPVEIRLKKATAVIVNVIDAATGKVVEDATVRFYYFYRAGVSLDSHSISPRNLSNGALTPIEPKALGRGRYEFRGVSAGPWVLEVLDKEHARYAKAFRDGVKENTIDVKLEGARTITGVLKQPQGMRPEQFKITFEAGGNNVEAQPDGQGRFKLEDVPPEEGSISVRTHDNNPGASWSLDLHSLPEQKLVLDFSEFFILEGRVTIAGENVANANIHAYIHEAGSWASSYARSGLDGHYRMFLPRKGKCLVQASTATGKVKLEIEIDKKTTSRDLQLITGAISGVLLDKLGAPLPFASVSAYRIGESPPAHFYNRWKEKAYEVSAFAGQGRTDRQGNFSIVGLTSGRYRVFGKTRELDQTYSDIIELTKEGERIENVRLTMVNIGGLDVQAVDAATGERLKDVGGRLHCIGIVAGRQRPGESIMKMRETPPGKYELVVGAPGYQSVILPAIEVKAKQRRTITAKLKQGGRLAVALRATPPDGNVQLRMHVVLKNVPAGKIAFQAVSNFSPNVGHFGLQGDETELRGTLSPGIAQGDYEATLYYMKMTRISDDPIGQFDVKFHIDAGKTTEIHLDEADMQPFEDRGPTRE